MSDDAAAAATAGDSESERERLLGSDVEPLLSRPRRRSPAMSAEGPAPAATASSGPSQLRNQILASIAATFGGLVVGMALGWTSTALETLRKDLDLNDSQESLVGSMMALGALFGGLYGGWAVEKLGRRSTMVSLAVPAMVGWLLITYAGKVGTVIAGRFITGLSSGATTLVGPTYVAEAVQANIRGTMGAAFQFQVTLGILVSYVVGKYVAWTWLALVSSVMPLVWLLMVCFLRESPLWLIDKNRELEAYDSLLWLRGPTYDVNSELAELRRQNQEMRAKQASFRDLKRRENLRPFIMSLVLMFLQQFSGINAVIFFTNDIFSDAGSSIDSNVSTIIVGVVQCLSTFAGVVLVDRLGRRVLLVLSDALMGLCLLLLGVYFILKKNGHDVSGIGWLPLVSLMVFIFAFSVGFGPIPWLMMGELFAPEVKGAAAGVATFFNWTLAFIVTETFKPLKAGLTEAGAFWFFACICFLGAAYVFFFVYETKGKTLEEICEHFRQ